MNAHVPAPAAGTPLYVHLPFCVAKCHYCDFFSVTAEGQDVDGLVDDLLCEAESAAPAQPRTVFLGGGTPSLLSAAQLGRLLDGLDRRTGFRGSAVEVTAECNPESLDEDKARALADLGVDRLSIGFQSLDPTVLATFGRVHDAAQSFAAFRAARRAGLRRLNVDLIYAHPGQTLAACEDELDRVLELEPDHLSAYNLAFEEGTPFETWLREGRLTPLPEERELELFWAVRERAAAAGFEAYEISNFARTGQQCRHNVNYWRNGDYAGLGPSAASKQGARRFGNPRSIAAWRAALRGTGPAPARSSAPAWSSAPGPPRSHGPKFSTQSRALARPGGSACASPRASTPRKPAPRAHAIRTRPRARANSRPSPPNPKPPSSPSTACSRPSAHQAAGA